MEDRQTHGKLAARLAGELGTAAAEAVFVRLVGSTNRPDAAAVLLTMLDELERVSGKAVEAAIQALPELDQRAGLAQVSSWLQLGVKLAASSGATALKYFKDSPRILGVIEPPSAQAGILAVALEMAEEDANVTLEYLRTAPQIVPVLPLDQMKSWLDIGLELIERDVVVGLEYVRQIPVLVPVLPLCEVRTWASFALSLVTPNSLGKPDYLATMEFLRTSPAFLSEVEQGTVRSKVLSLGAMLAGHSPGSGVSCLVESPRLLKALPSLDWQIRLLQYAPLLGEKDAEVTLAYLRHSPEMIGLLGTGPGAISRFEGWFGTGMEILEYSKEGALAYFTVESQKALASVETALSGVPLRTVARRIKLFVQGLCGSEVAITALPGSIGSPSTRATVGDNGRSIALPSICRHFPTAAENERWYLLAAAHEAGHLEFGTYRLKLDVLADLIETVSRRYGRLEGASPQTLADLFRLYPSPLLVRDLWIVLEDARVEFLLNAQYPGLRRDLTQLSLATMVPRDPAEGLTVKELIVDCLLRLSVGESESTAVPRAIGEEVRELWAMARAIHRMDSTAEEVVRLVDAVYVRMDELIGQHRTVSPTAPAEEKPEELGAGPSSSDPTSDTYRPISTGLFRGTMIPELVRGGADSSGVGDRPQETDGLHRQEDGLLAESDAGYDTARGERSQTEGGPLAGGRSLPSKVEELLAMNVAETERKKTTLPGKLVASYPEWDESVQDYRLNWCRVVERPVEAASDEFVSRVLSIHQSTIKSLRRVFEGLRSPNFRRVSGQSDGDELDIDAVVRRVAELRAGMEAGDRLFIRRDKKERNVAVAFLVDVSGSTSRQLDSGQRVIEVEQESLVLLCESLEAVGDRYALYAYSGQGRGNVEFLTIKDFEERLGAGTANRLGGLHPRQQNRDGAAIRHAVAKLRARDEKTRLLILLSDGRPLDQGYKDEYALADTKAALREARFGGIHTFCVTIDREADSYVRRMYGDTEYAVMDRVESLPSKLPKIYQRLTT